MPKDMAVEARHQTHHKLETMDRYWRTWARIIAQARYGWCSRHMWLVDTMAGAGLHLSEGDRDGVVAGTPFQAVRAAIATQREFDVEVHVRAIDINAGFASALGRLVAPYRGSPPDSVDVRVHPVDWVAAVPEIAAEITAGDFGQAQPGHRSLWFIDPYGVEPLDRRIIETLPPHAEVIVNFDENAMRRHAGKDLGLIANVYPDERWRAAIGTGDGAFAASFAESFPGYRFKSVYPLRPSGSQDRFFVHLTQAEAAVGAFDRCRKTALKVGTLIAGDNLTSVQKHDAAASLMERFKAQRLTVDEMIASGAGYRKVPLRAICASALELGYADSWDARTGTIEWRFTRTAEPGLGL